MTRAWGIPVDMLLLCEQTATFEDTMPVQAC